MAATAGLVACALWLAGCSAGGSGATTSPSASPPAPSPVVKPTGPTVNATDAHGTSGFAFSPKTIEVNPGQSVTFVNSGSTAHTATADAAGSWDSANLAPGQTFTTPALTKPGTYTYSCKYHKALGMTGTIIVLPT